MVSTGRTTLKKLWAALDECLPNYRKKESEHHWKIYPPNGGKTFHRLSLGEHGSRVNAEVQRGQVKSLARQFGVHECVMAHIDKRKRQDTPQDV